MGQMQKFVLVREKLKKGMRKVWQFIKPGPDAWKGAGLGLVCSFLFLVFYSFYPILKVASPNRIALLTVLYFLVCTALLVLLYNGLLRLLSGLPVFFRSMLFATIISFVLTFSRVFSGRPWDIIPNDFLPGLMRVIPF